MDIKGAMGRTGRKMDAAWKAAISRGLKAGGTGVAAAKTGARKVNVGSYLGNKKINAVVGSAVGKAGSAIGKASGALSGKVNRMIKPAAIGGGNKVQAAVANAAARAKDAMSAAGNTKAAQSIKSGASKVAQSAGVKKAGMGARVAGAAMKAGAKTRTGKAVMVGAAGAGAIAATRKDNSVKGRVKRVVKSMKG